MANLDSRSKRASSVGILLPFLLSPVLPDGAISQGDRQHTAFSYSGIAAAGAAASTDPEDLDSDIAVTARTDHDGATIRPPRTVFYHAPDGAREDSYVGFDRAYRIDRHYQRSSRGFRTISVGNRFDIGMDAIRAGETFALHRLVVWVSPEEARPRVAVNTDRTDHEGATLGVQSLRLVVAADGAREADMETLDVFVTDRWVARYAVPSAQGLGQFFEIEIGSLGRAGHAFALDRLVMWVSDRAEARPGNET